MAKAKPKRLKQRHFEGMEPPTIKPVEHAAETYYETMMERVELSKKESEAQDNLLERMIENGIERYEFDEFVVVVTKKSKAAVKRKKHKAESNGDGQ